MAIDYTKRRPIVLDSGDTGSAAAIPGNTGTPVGNGGGVSLSKVTLTKAHPSVSLIKAATSGLLRVNLNWTARPAASSGGFLKRAMAGAAPGIDLDLGCLYEFTDGSMGVVQALGNAFSAKGSFTDKRLFVFKRG